MDYRVTDEQGPNLILHSGIIWQPEKKISVCQIKHFVSQPVHQVIA